MSGPGKFSSKIVSISNDCRFDYSKIDAVCQRIVDVFRPHKIIIFGSVAKGTAGPDSDIDMVIIMDTDLPYMKRSVAIYGSIDEFRTAADILVLTPNEYQKDLKDETSFLNSIGKDGVEVYAA
ncbi:nucleotidyltransferase domain-containing protein [Candidatus Methanarcanum hacksteinii]|uniref:nucleotidyltransferase domain-containing protein n=1 Tax=Candidatus Methanarcanum hacksteinii TaxID=2911857 RepID=UPI0015AD368B